MRATRDGIVLDKAELKALLEFSHAAPDSMHAVVHFEVSGEHVHAYATTTARSVEVQGVAESDAHEGVWSVYRDFLVACHKLIGSEQHLVLEVSHSSLNRAVVMGEGEDGELVECASMTWPRDASVSQSGFTAEGFRRYVQLPAVARRVKCVTVSAAHLGALAVVSKAAGESVDLYVGKDRSDPLFFRFDGDFTTWTGSIVPRRSPADMEDTEE